MTLAHVTGIAAFGGFGMATGGMAALAGDDDRHPVVRGASTYGTALTGGMSALAVGLLAVDGAIPGRPLAGMPVAALVGVPLAAGAVVGWKAVQSID